MKTKNNIREQREDCARAETPDWQKSKAGNSNWRHAPRKIGCFVLPTTPLAKRIAWPCRRYGSVNQRESSKCALVFLSLRFLHYRTFTLGALPAVSLAFCFSAITLFDIACFSHATYSVSSRSFTLLSLARCQLMSPRAPSHTESSPVGCSPLSPPYKGKSFGGEGLVANNLVANNTIVKTQPSVFLPKVAMARRFQLRTSCRITLCSLRIERP